MKEYIELLLKYNTSAIDVFKEAKKAIQLLKPKSVIPVHYNTFDLIKQEVNNNLVENSNSQLFIPLTNQKYPPPFIS